MAGRLARRAAARLLGCRCRKLHGRGCRGRLAARARAACRPGQPLPALGCVVRGRLLLPGLLRRRAGALLPPRSQQRHYHRQLVEVPAADGAHNQQAAAHRKSVGQPDLTHLHRGFQGITGRDRIGGWGWGGGGGGGRLLERPVRARVRTDPPAASRHADAGKAGAARLESMGRRRWCECWRRGCARGYGPRPYAPQHASASTNGAAWCVFLPQGPGPTLYSTMHPNRLQCSLVRFLPATGPRPHVVEHHAHKQVERHPEEVDDGGPHLLGHVGAAHRVCWEGSGA